ncbi:MAG: hypothetical protein H6525_01005 [Actinobacteria bacterium]|nr:hypothetical protein [Actinomycetota bacterium]MCB9411421.1 hypothetical protein [Actinomycetota bacterium]
MKRTLVVAGVGLLLLAGCGAPSTGSDGEDVRSTDHLVADPPTSGTYVADSGFRPDPDGFSFPNYGDEAGVAELGAAQLVELFGQQACESPSGAVCRLGSPATTWLQVMNNAAAGGHCEGMAALSQVFAAGVESPRTYGAEAPYALPFDGNEPLQRDIARWFSTQATEPTQGSETRGVSPVDVLDTLIATLGEQRTPENTYTLGIFQPEFAGGHAITPYAVEDRGDGIFWIMVYDNNFPGAARAVAVDRENETWSYLASTNPDAPESVYRGDADSGTLTLTPLAPRLAPQECPFCAGETVGQTVADGTNQFSLTGPGAERADTDFYLTDAAEQRLGRVSGVLVRDIPDGEIVPLAQGPGLAPAPFLETPATLDTTVSISTELAASTLDFAMIGAGYDVLISGVDAPADSPATVKLAADGSRIVYSQLPTAGPTVSAAVENDGGYLFDFAVDVIEFGAQGAELTIASPDDRADVALGATTSGRYRIEVTTVDPNDTERRFTFPDVTLEAGQQLVLDFEQWQGESAPQGRIADGEGEPITTLNAVESGL